MIETAALICLALNVYFEARDQPVAGQVAVAQVTMNRVQSGRFPDDVCSVVYQHKQFSWYSDGKSDRPQELKAWNQAKLVASAVLAGSVHKNLEGALFYHTVYIEPYWSKKMQLVARIDDHVFYGRL